MSKYKRSPLAPEHFPNMPVIAGFDMATAEAGIKYKGRTDLWVLRGQAGTQVAGVYTKNLMPGAPIDWSRAALFAAKDDGGPKLVVVNSGTANVFTGAVGKAAVEMTARSASQHFGGSEASVQIASTGVIGQPLDSTKLTAVFPGMATHMGGDSWADAARAIMTTDTYPKGAHVTAMIDDVPVSINGIAKGSGMIAPDMATMLGYIATDANIAQGALQDLLVAACEPSFNAITVDSDTSTSDTVLLLASCAAAHDRVIVATDPRLDDFTRALKALCHDLAQQVIRDGEGATKLIEVRVGGAHSDASAKIIAKSIANSPLVKTAIAGEDANWGRIIMAVGKSGQPANRDALSIAFGPHIVAENGFVSGNYTEAAGSEYMKQSELVLSIDVGVGNGRAVIWSCDLTHGYIDINADYRS